MQIFVVARDYLLWHYSAAYLDILGIARNFFWFFGRFFALFDILKNLFAPFNRLKEEPVSVFRHPKEFFGNLLVNTLMRVVGLVLRLMIIVIALSCFALTLLFALLLIVVWTALPIIVPSLFMSGLLILLP